MGAALHGDPFRGLDEDPSTANAALETVDSEAGSESVVEKGECLAVRPELKGGDLRVRALFISEPLMTRRIEISTPQFSTPISAGASSFTLYVSSAL